MKNLLISIIYLFLITGIVPAQSQNTLKSQEDYIEFKKKLMNYENFSVTTKNVPNNTFHPHSLKSSFDDFGDPPEWNWVSQFGGSGADYGKDIFSDDDDNIYITGSFSGEISIGSNSYTSIGRWDAFVAKFQSTGNFIWLKQFSASPEENIESNSINLDNSGNIYFTGYYTGSVSIGSFNLPNNAGYNLFFTKLSPDGNVLLAKNHGTSEDTEIGLKIDTDNDGNIYILGSADGSTGWKYPSIILKYNQGGNLLWSYENDENFYDMVVFGSNLYFAGTILYDGYIGDFYLDPVHYNDVFLAKSDLNLNFEWVSMAGHSSNYDDSFSTGLYINQSEEIFITGSFLNDIILGEIELQGCNGFIAKCSASGEFIWASHISDYIYDDYIPIDISGGNNIAYVCYSNVITAFITTNGNIVNTNNLDYEPVSIDYNFSDNKINIIGDVDQIICTNQLNETLQTQWFFQFGGNSAFGWVIGMGTDQYGKLYTYGYASNEFQYFGQTFEKGLFLAKQDGAGNIIWLRHFPEAYESCGYGSYLVTDTINQYVYITGTFDEPFVIPGITTLTPDEYISIFIVKYDFNGNYQWSIQEDFYGDYLCLAPDYSGNILISGTFWGSINIGNTILNSAGADDVFISKYNSSGNFLWAKRAGGEEREYSGFISTDPDNNIYFAGEFLSKDVTVDNYSITLEQGDGNILFAKLDTDGNVLWVTSKAGSPIYGGDWHCFPTGIQTDNQGYSYIKGWHGDSTYFDNIMLRSPYGLGFSYFIAKFDTDGNTIWANSITEHKYGFDYNQFDLDYIGNVYLGAQIRDTIHFGNDFTYINVGNNDLFVTKYTTDGILDWVKIMESSTGYCWLSSVAVYNTNCVFAGGHFINYIRFGETELYSNNTHGFITLISEETGITVYERNDKDFSFKIYPNPTCGNFKILFENLENENAEMVITDISGKIIYSRSLNQIPKALDVDIPVISNGTYFIKIQSGNISKVEKLVKK